MKKIKKIDNLKIIEEDNKKICIKRVNNSLLNRYNYLRSKGFYNIFDYKINNGYEIRSFVDEIDISKEDKIYNLIYLIAMLHTKTTHYKNISLDEIKTFYEKETDEIIDIKNYYNTICENNDYKMLLLPSINLLIDNISLLFISLDKSKYFLDKWYEVVKDKKRKRVVLNHNNLKISNYIVSDNSYLINWDKSIIDTPVIDLYSLFKNNIDNIDLIDCFNTYKTKYVLYEEEVLFLYFKLLKIDKVLFDKDEFDNTTEVYDIINYLEIINEFLEYNLKSEK